MHIMAYTEHGFQKICARIPRDTHTCKNYTKFKSCKYTFLCFARMCVLNTLIKYTFCILVLLFC